MRVWLPTIRAGTGMDVFAERLADGLKDAGVDPILTWYRASYELAPELLRGKRRPEHFDIIHANSGYAHVFLGLGIPLVTTVPHLVHDPAYKPYTSLAQRLYHRWHVRWRESRVIQRADAVTTMSDYVAGTVRAIFHRDDMQVIPSWVNLQRYTPDAAYCFSDQRPFRLLWVGNHSRRKGADLVRPLTRLLGHGFDLRCTGGLRDDMGLTGEQGITLLGRLSEDALIREYQNCDAVLSLSRYEGFGYTALEGMACAKPVLGFRTSALNELVREGETGMLCATDDVTALASNIRELANDMTLLQRMGAEGRQSAMRDFSRVDAIKNYVALYESLLRAPR